MVLIDIPTLCMALPDFPCHLSIHLHILSWISGQKPIPKPKPKSKPKLSYRNTLQDQDDECRGVTLIFPQTSAKEQNLPKLIPGMCTVVIRYRISSYSFRANYSFLNLETQRSQYIRPKAFSNIFFNEEMAFYSNC